MQVAGIHNAYLCILIYLKQNLIKWTFGFFAEYKKIRTEEADSVYFDVSLLVIKPVITNLFSLTAFQKRKQFFIFRRNNSIYRLIQKA